VQRLGRAMARHRRWVAVAWLIIVLGAGYLNGVFSKSVSDNFRIPNAGSQDAYDLLQERFQSQNGATATVVFSVPKGQSLTDSDNAAAVAAATTAVAKARGVATAPDPLTESLQNAVENFAGKLPPNEAQALLAVEDNLPPQLSKNGRIAYTTVTFDRSLNDLIDAYPVNPDTSPTDYQNPYSALQHVADALPRSNVRIAIGGLVANTWNQPVSWWANHADEVGLLLGAILLLLAFGSVWGMAIPIAVALLGAITAGGLVYLLADFITVSSAAPPVTLMIALGVGLDYSLLIVTRYRQHVHDGRSTEDAVGLALGSAGKASMFAGTTVCIALLGLLFVPIPLVQTLGVAAAIGVAVMMLAACTLLPALLGFAGHKIDALRLPWSKRARHHDRGADHDRRLRVVRHQRQPDREAHRVRHGRCGAHRLHAAADGARPRRDGAVRQGRVVVPALARVDPSREHRGHTRAGAGTGTATRCRDRCRDRGRDGRYDGIARPVSNRVLRSLRIHGQPPPPSLA